MPGAERLCVDRCVSARARARHARRPVRRASARRATGARRPRATRGCPGGEKCIAGRFEPRRRMRGDVVHPHVVALWRRNFDGEPRPVWRQTRIYEVEWALVPRSSLIDRSLAKSLARAPYLSQLAAPRLRRDVLPCSPPILPRIASCHSAKESAAVSPSLSASSS